MGALVNVLLFHAELDQTDGGVEQLRLAVVNSRLTAKVISIPPCK